MAEKNNLELVTVIVSAYVENNRLQPSELTGLISSVAAALSQTGQQPQPEPAQKRLTPNDVRRSIKPDGLVSFEDGRTYKTLKRHLSTKGLTPHEYREKWGLPADYPMVAPAYAEQRSKLAREMGLGQGGRKGANRKVRR